MSELLLSFDDPEKGETTVSVDADEFVIGRHSDCDLVIRHPKLSREHAKIQRFGDIFVVSDLGSSNGTVLNDKPLEDPESIRNGDVLELGGGVRIELIGDTDEEEGSEDDDSQKAAESAAASPPTVEASSASAPSGRSGLRTALIVAPLLGIFILLIAAVALIALYGTGSTTTSSGLQRPDPIETGDFDPMTPDDTPLTTPTATPGTVFTPVDPGTSTPTPMGDGALPTPIVSTPQGNGNGTAGGIDRKKEALVYSFLRKIAKNDRRPYLTTARFNEVMARTARFRGSSALAANISNASANAAQIRSIADSKGIQPQFLAAAAITRLGNARGDVARTAGEMADVLDKLTIVLSNELADDALLVIAAYDEGKAGNTLKMRDRLANLAKKNPTASPREIRTIWFLQEKGEISGAQYNFALNFIAVGTIAQAPREFGVNARAFSF